MKCSGCGEEIIEGSKFCQECGTPVPQFKLCISCGAELPLDVKFCQECGAKQETEGENLSTTGINMGEKNVIAGDVVSNVTNNTQVHHNENIVNNVTNNVSNTTTTNTTIINQDDSKKVVVCESCGRSVLITESYKCNKCGKTVCKDCFDIDNSICYLCSPSQKVSKHFADDIGEFISKINEIDEKIDRINRSGAEIPYDTSSVGGFGKSLMKNMGNAFRSSQERSKLWTEKENLITSFMPFESKKSISDAVVFIEMKRDTVIKNPNCYKDWKSIWGGKLISLINQAQILFGDDQEFIASLQKHAKYASAVENSKPSSMADKMVDSMNNMVDSMNNMINSGMKIEVPSMMSFFGGKNTEEASGTIRCSNCGSDIPKEKKFCTKCGSKL